jgi:hypothetical protein
MVLCFYLDEHLFVFTKLTPTDTTTKKATTYDQHQHHPLSTKKVDTLFKGI